MALGKKQKSSGDAPVVKSDKRSDDSTVRATVTRGTVRTRVDGRVVDVPVGGSVEISRKDAEKAERKGNVRIL